MGEHRAELSGAHTDARCPHCAATTRPGAPWCTQCYAELQPSALRTAPDPVPHPRPGHLDARTAPATALGLPPTVPLAASWPCTACGTGNALSQGACVACGTGFLAGLRDAGGPQVVVPGVGDLASMPRAKRLALAAAVVLLLLVLTAVLGVLAS